MTLRQAPRNLLARATALGAAAVLLSLAVCADAVLTREALESAESRWASQGVESYTVEISVTESGRELRRVHLEVRSGKLARGVMSVDGGERNVDGEAARPYTVEGLFRTLEEELEAGKRRYVRARFDAKLGFPDRIELGPLRGVPEVTHFVLRIVSFQPASPTSPPSPPGQ